MLNQTQQTAANVQTIEQTIEDQQQQERETVFNSEHQFYACPYSWNLQGFYFHGQEDYGSKLKRAQAVDPSGDFEHEVEFIDGDADLWSLSGQSLSVYFEQLEDWEALSDEEKAIVKHLAQNQGLSLPEALERLEYVQWQHGSTKDAAYDWAKFCFSLDGVALQYFDCEAFARDCVLNGEWTELYLGQGEYLTIINEHNH
ncbi:antirestriction protein ArdA [Ferrimonas sp. YFM]|uniref:antirestriction protein ArdA n=1 Tax=Ferrimonas sp. YFM TaxID=3028878 RepID=UPI002574572D|nr:antirestriction protein ArdA [Ferrimonas sp. YFM]BDY05385.1 hypothetical protein F0521_24260 [Ferrimonas sp. YFM]